MVTLYTIFTIRTEYTPEYRRNAAHLLAMQFYSFNIVVGTGYWKGQREQSMTIEIICEAWQRGNIMDIADRIRAANRQEAVFVTQQPLQASLVYETYTKAA